MTATYSGDENNENVTKTSIVYTGSSINAKDLIRGWNSPYDYEAEFLDSQGHVLKNTEVTMIVDGTEYKVKTDEKGIAKLTSKLAMGTYNVTLINPVTGKQTNHSVKIVERLIGNKDITMDFLDGSSYIIRAIGDDGKPVGAGEVIGFRVNGDDYYAVTNESGYAKIVIQLNPKDYTMTAQYSAYKVSNKIKVKQTLKLVTKTITVKKTAKSFKIKATLKWSNGKAISGKKITIKFRGKSYNVKTDKKGVAQLTIKKNIIKKLKKGRKYTINVNYVTNSVTGIVKVKK